MPKRMADRAEGRGQNHAPAKKSKRAHKVKRTLVKAQQETSETGDGIPSEHDPKHSSSSKAVPSKTQASSSTLPQHNKQKANAGVVKPQWRTKREKKRLRKQLLKQQRKLLDERDSLESERQGSHSNDNLASNSLNAAVSAIEPQKARDQHVCTRTTLMCAPVKLWTVAKELPVHAEPAKADDNDTKGQASPSRDVCNRQAQLGRLPTTPSLRRELLRTKFERQECGESGLTHRSTSSCSAVTPVQRLVLSQAPNLGSTVNKAGAHDPRRNSLQLSQRALTVPSRSTPVNAERTFQDFSRFLGESSDPSDDDHSVKSDADGDLEQKSKKHVKSTLDKPDQSARQSTSPRDDHSEDADKTIKQASASILKHEPRDQMQPPRQIIAQSSHLAHAAITNTDDEDDNVEQELFDDIRKVWEEVTSITRSTSLSTRNKKAPAARSSSMIRKPKIGYYDLPAGPLSAHMVRCQQAVVDDQPPPANRKRKRVSGIDSKPLPLENESEPRTAANQKDTTSTNIDASLCSTSDQDVRQTKGHHDSVTAQTTPRTSKKRRAAAGVSTALFPPISSDRFGLLQEKLWQEPFWLLIAVTFLNKTAGKAAAPVFWELKECYPTPADLADAKLEDVRDMITHLGLQTQRATRILKMAKAWHNTPPVKGRLHRTLHYPQRGEGKEYGLEDAIEADTPTVAGALEIGHIPGCGPYAWDSWRIFCRDVFRGVADDYNGLNAGEDFEAEWQRVLPMDKELRACLRWMWLREGYIWDHETGNKREVNDLEREKAINGELGPTDEDEIKFTARAQETPLTPVKAPTRRSLRLSGS